MIEGWSGSLGLPIEGEGIPYAAMGNPSSIEVDTSPAAWKQVFRYAYFLVGNRAEAEDLTQDAFVILFRETQSGRPVEQVGAWMRTVTRRLACRHFYESRPDLHMSLDAVNEQGSRIMSEPRDPTPSVEKKIIDENLLRLGAKVLYQLTEKDRGCLMMYFRGYDFMQIATPLGISRWTARRITLKALKKLQSRIDRSQKCSRETSH